MNLISTLSKTVHCFLIKIVHYFLHKLFLAFCIKLFSVKRVNNFLNNVEQKIILCKMLEIGYAENSEQFYLMQ